ncbi:MAG: glycosyltransferase [Sulfolobales archaeon]
MKVIKVREFVYPTYVGGIETCLHQLLPALAELGAKITLLTCAERGLPRCERKGSVEVRRIEFLGLIGALTARLKERGTLYGMVARALFLLTLPIHLIRALKEAGAEIIHVHCLCALSALPASIVRILARKLLIITMHGTFLGCYDKVVKPPLSWIIPAIEKAYLRLKLYDKILVEDKYTYRTLRNLGIPRGKIQVLPYPGIDTRRFRDARPIDGLSGGPIILHHGRLVQKRGVKNLIEAMPKIIKEIPGAKLVIAGEGPEKQRLQRLAEKLSVASHVTFLGLVPYEYVPSLVKSSTVVVIPSLMEGHSASVIEAMAAAKPVIATRVGGVAEIIKDGETGVLVDPESPDQIANAVVKILKDRDLARKLAEKAAEKAGEHDARKLAEEELSVYTSLINEKKSRPEGALGSSRILKPLILLAAIVAQAIYMLPSISNLTLRVTSLQDELLYSWVTLSACLLWLILKWRRIAYDVTSHKRITAGRARTTLGLALCASSLAAQLAFEPQDFFVAAIPASIFISGVFAALGSLVPLVISCAYVAGIALPAIIGEFADKPLSEFSASVTTITLRALGIQASAQGAYIKIPVATGGAINAYIDHVCAGSTSLSVFMCLFTLVTVDLWPKPGWKIAVFLAAGSLGTIAQATLRLIIMGVVGASYGMEAFLTAHKYLGYILFPIYFIAFTYIYVRSAHKSKALTPTTNRDGQAKRVPQTLGWEV